MALDIKAPPAGISAPYRRSLHDACVLQGATFDGFVHVDDWVPQRLVTATGPNPLPR